MEVKDLSASAKSLPAVQPGDVIQCLFVLSPVRQKKQELFDKARRAGGVMGLGKLDIRWYSKVGDAGHLATNQLIRRLPPIAQRPLSSLMTPRPLPVLQQNRSPSSLMAPTPQQTPARPGFTGGAADMRTPSPMHSPRIAAGTISPSPRHSAQMDEVSRQAVGTDLLAFLRVMAPGSASVDMSKPFRIDCELELISISVAKQRRRLKLAVQHVDHHRVAIPTIPLASNDQLEVTSKYAPKQSFETNKTLPATPRRSFEAAAPDSSSSSSQTLPPPYPLSPSHPFYFPPNPSQASDTNEAIIPSIDVHFVGHSLLDLEDVVFDHGQASVPDTPQEARRNVDESSSLSHSDIRVSIDSTATDDMSLDDIMQKQATRRQQTQTVPFSLTYIANARGILPLGGLRILLLQDRWMSGKDEGGEEEEQGLEEGEGIRPCSLLEYNVILEVLVN